MAGCPIQQPVGDRPAGNGADLTEISAVAVFLAALLAVRIGLALHLSDLGVFEQYNVLFDADPNQYVSAIANGSNFARIIHPGFALLLNAPIRWIEYLGEYSGLWTVGTIGGLAALLLSPFASVVGAFLWWSAAIKLGLSAWLRICGLVFSQVAFGQTVFSVVPESYGISGAMYTLLLYLVAVAANCPDSLNRAQARIQWLLLACAMSAVTVTNGFVCVLAWVSIRLGKTQFQKVLMEGCVATCILVGAIASYVIADRWIYKTPISENISSVEAAERWVRRYSSDQPASRLVEVPAGYLASIFSPGVDRAENKQSNATHKYQFMLSARSRTGAMYMVAAGWVALAMLIGQFALRSDISATVVRGAIAVLAANAVLHSFFGQEMLLYSQHWHSFLACVVVLVISDAFGNRASWILPLLAIAASSLTLASWSHILDALSFA